MSQNLVTLASGNETACVIWLHGLGDTPDGWSDVGRDLRKKLPHIRWVLPEAPVSKVTCNAGYESTSWMDLIDIPITLTSPDNGLQQEESIALVHKLINEQGMPTERIVVGGFSQGAALALASTVKFPKKLGGCVIFSGWTLPKQNLEERIKTSANKETKFLVCHGDYDNVVLKENADYVTKTLKSAGCSVEQKSYEFMAHSSCPEEIADLHAFLKETIPKTEN